MIYDIIWLILFMDEIRFYKCDDLFSSSMHDVRSFSGLQNGREARHFSDQRAQK